MKKVNRYLVTYTIRCIAVAHDEKDAREYANGNLEHPPVSLDQSNYEIEIEKLEPGPVKFPVIGNADAFAQQG